MRLLLGQDLPRRSMRLLLHHRSSTVHASTSLTGCGLWFCGWEKKDFSLEPRRYVDERQKRSFTVYQAVLRQARERLKQDGVLILHLGKSRKSNMSDALVRVSAPWFRVVDRFDESVTHTESHGIRDKGTVTSHQYLVLA